MTEMRIILPGNHGCPMIIEHEDFLENEDITLNLKFGTYELTYGYIEECAEHGDKLGVPHIMVLDKEMPIFSESFNHNWILFLDITKKSRIKHEISIKIYNKDDGDNCETCENNRFHFELNAMVDTYTYCYYSPPIGEFQKHLPEKPGEYNEEIQNKLK